MFLIIGADETADDLTAVQELSPSVSMLVLDLLAIVYRPFGPNDRFGNSGDVQGIFDLIEEVPGFSIELDDLLLPAELLESRSPQRVIHQGDLFRISTRLFSLAFQFRQELLALPAFLEASAAEADAIERSDDEAAAFRAWNERQIEEAREYHHANRNRMLPRKSK